MDIQNAILYWSLVSDALHSSKANIFSKTYLQELQYDSEYNIDVWYSHCKSFTFDTQFLPISCYFYIHPTINTSLTA